MTLKEKQEKCSACEEKEKYPVGKPASIKTASGGVAGIVYIKCPIHEKKIKSLT